MKGVLEYVKREPAVLLSLLGAVISLAAAFGFDLSGEQTGAITAVAVVVLGIVTRQSVTPNVKVAAKVDNGEVVTGQATPPEGVPAQVVDVELDGPYNPKH